MSAASVTIRRPDRSGGGGKKPSRGPVREAQLLRSMAGRAWLVRAIRARLEHVASPGRRLGTGPADMTMATAAVSTGVEVETVTILPQTPQLIALLS